MSSHRHSDDPSSSLAVRVTAFFFGVLLKVLRFTPWKLRRAISRQIGNYAARRHMNRQMAARANLDLAFGNSKSFEEKERIALESFRNFAGCMVDAVSMIPSLTKDNWTRYVRVPEEDLIRTREYLARGKGVILMFSHYGNWELMGACLPFMDLRQVHVVAKRQSPWANPFLERFRSGTGNKVVYKEGAIRKCLSALKRGELVGFAIDQNFSQGVFVPFFGVEAGTSDTLAALARTSGAAIVPLVCTPNGDGTYSGRLMPEVETKTTDDKQADIHDITRRCLAHLEGIIRERPELWLWSHKRWKSRPPHEEPKRDIYSSPLKSERAGDAP
ncbi:MAG: lysophospholipid acyltransferase family protein [Leptospirillia bacterium]